jgi:hypothetical protein
VDRVERDFVAENDKVAESGSIITLFQFSPSQSTQWNPNEPSRHPATALPYLFFLLSALGNALSFRLFFHPTIGRFSFLVLLPTPSMPYIDIAQGNDFASLWYITNSPTGHVSSFHPDKPTVILLHPFFLDSTWLDSQFGDPRLNEDHNLIAFDQRAAGRTLSRPNGRQDSWTDAADLAFACHVR